MGASEPDLAYTYLGFAVLTSTTLTDASFLGSAGHHWIVLIRRVYILDVCLRLRGAVVWLRFKLLSVRPLALGELFDLGRFFGRLERAETVLIVVKVVHDLFFLLALLLRVNVDVVDFANLGVFDVD